MAQTVKSLPAMQETRFDPWVGKIPSRRKCLFIPVFLPGESHGQRSLAGYSPGGCKESDMTEATACMQEIFFSDKMYALFHTFVIYRKVPLSMNQELLGSDASVF